VTFPVPNGSNRGAGESSAGGKKGITERDARHAFDNAAGHMGDVLGGGEPALGIAAFVEGLARVAAQVTKETNVSLGFWFSENKARDYEPRIVCSNEN
jgi:hypothetical protein